MISRSNGFGVGMFGTKGMPYRGIGTHGDIPGPPYCTDLTYSDLLAKFGVEDCAAKYDSVGDVAGSYACVQRNAPKLQQVLDWQNNCSYQNQASAYNPAGVQQQPQYVNVATGYNDFINSYLSGAQPFVVVNQPTATSAGTGGSGSPGMATMVFLNLTSGNNQVFHVGDQYQIKISGATPNSQVSVNATHNGVASSAVMGSTDGNGNFTTSGSMYDGSQGTWQETWTTAGGGISGGSITFSVQDAVTTPTYVPPPQSTTSNPATSGPAPVPNNAYVPPNRQNPTQVQTQPVQPFTQSPQAPNSYTLNPSSYPDVNPTAVNPFPNFGQQNIPTNPVSSQVNQPSPTTYIPAASSNLPSGTNASTTSTNTTNSGVSASFGSDFLAGFENVFNFSSWGTIFSSGDTAAILGLLTPLAVVGWIGLGFLKKAKVL